jgi:hypothetical protein
LVAAHFADPIVSLQPYQFARHTLRSGTHFTSASSSGAAKPKPQQKQEPQELVPRQEFLKQVVHAVKQMSPEEKAAAAPEGAGVRPPPEKVMPGRVWVLAV